MTKRTVMTISAVVSILVCTAQELLPVRAIAMGSHERVNCECVPKCEAPR
jgi:hypothetical protein